MQIEKYFPAAVKETKEFKEIARAENPLVTELWNNTGVVFNEIFVMTMGPEGISRYEKILDIVPETEDSEERRMVIAAMLLSVTPFTLPFLEERTKMYFGTESSVKVEYNDYHVSIRAVENYDENKRAFKVFLRKILPANMGYHLIQYAAVSNNLKIKSGLGSSISVKLPLGESSSGEIIKLKAHLGSNIFVKIPSGTRDTGGIMGLAADMGSGRTVRIPLAE